MQFTVASAPFSDVIASVSPPHALNAYPADGTAVMVSVVADASCTTFVVTVAAAAPSPNCTVPLPSADTVTVFRRFVCASNNQPTGNVSVAGFAPRKRTASTAVLIASSSAVSTRL